MAQAAAAFRPPAEPTVAPPDAARRFLPPPGVHPNSAVFGAVNLPKPLTWQRREHMVQRRSILGRIGQLLKRNAQLVLQDAAEGGGDVAHAKTWALARKLEVLIFLNSASLLEYNNVDSLARRVQAMTASIVNKKIRREIVSHTQEPVRQAAVLTATAAVRIPAPIACRPAVPGFEHPPFPPPLIAHDVQPSFTEMMRSAMVGEDTVPASSVPLQATSSPTTLRFDQSVSQRVGKRTANESVGLYSSPANPKRVCLHQLHPVMATTTKNDRIGQLLFSGYEELNKIVWSFVDGVQIMRSRSVSRAARMLAPLFVTSLQLSCNAVQLALNTFSITSGACILRDCVNLKELEIVSLSSGMTFGKLSMRAMNCPQRFVVTHDDHEQIVLALSEQLRFKAFPLLTRLGLTCLFTNEEADGEADVLLNNLMTGCCPQLEELCLPGNSFGDYGAIKVAQMLRSRVCSKLTRLDLRRNFISEEGIRSVCHALADGCAPNLVELCLGGNTITDSCFHHVLFAMESRKLDKLRFLGIEMNYLTATSMEMLGRTIGKMVCPSLSQISYSDNSVNNADAKRLIATAVYQERMFRMRQQQLRHQQRISAQISHQRPSVSFQQQQNLQPHPSIFPYTHDYPSASNPRGAPNNMSAYSSEAQYSSGDDDEDEDGYSSDGD